MGFPIIPPLLSPSAFRQMVIQPHRLTLSPCLQDMLSNPAICWYFHSNFRPHLGYFSVFPTLLATWHFPRLKRRVGGVGCCILRWVVGISGCVARDPAERHRRRARLLISANQRRVGSKCWMGNISLCLRVAPRRRAPKLQRKFLVRRTSNFGDLVDVLWTVLRASHAPTPPSRCPNCNFLTTWHQCLAVRFDLWSLWTKFWRFYRDFWARE